MAHHHEHEQINGKNLIITMLLNFIITIAEFAGGLLSGSLSLMSDALHNFSDGMSVIISYLALKISKRENTQRMTFGYKRAEILAALFNSSVLVIISVYLFKEAYFKLIKPEPINGGLMIIIAIIGLVANALSVLLLKEGADKNLNVKSAYMHLLSDTLSSIGVVVGGVMISAYRIYWVDPLLTVLIGIYIIKESFEIINEAVSILMQAAPRDINIKDIQEKIEGLPEVKNIHHVHIWKTNDDDVHFECHVNMKEDLTLSQSKSVRNQIEEVLKELFHIHHVTLQMEYQCCEDVGLIKNEKD